MAKLIPIIITILIALTVLVIYEFGGFQCNKASSSSGQQQEWRQMSLLSTFQRKTATVTGGAPPSAPAPVSSLDKNMPSKSSSSITDSTSLAFHDSLGFFTGISDDIWKIRRQIAQTRRKSANPDNPMKFADSNSPMWYQMNWEPNLACINEEMIGQMGDGHKWICDPYRIEQQSREREGNGQQPCLVYSIGSKGKFDFESDAQKFMPQCEIHTFDLTDYSHMIPKGLNLTFHAWGLKPSYESETLTTSDGFDLKYSNKIWEAKPSPGIFKTIQQTVQELNHTNRIIDIFKIDCEGCEWYSYKDWINDIDIRQIQIEVHMTPTIVFDFLSDLQKANFAMFHKEPNIMHSGGRCVEFAFLKMNASYFG